MVPEICVTSSVKKCLPNSIAIVLGKIDEILAWEQRKKHERDERFVELGQYLCEMRAGQYWRLEKPQVVR
jgi:hypothetical protein